MTFAVAGGGRVSGSFVARLPRLARDLGPSHRILPFLLNQSGAPTSNNAGCQDQHWLWQLPDFQRAINDTNAIATVIQSTSDRRAKDALQQRFHLWITRQ
jgi:hypothetical protein